MNGKRLVELKTYNKLKAIGFGFLNGDNSVVVDRNDPRADLKQFTRRKIESQLNSGVSVRDIEELSDEVKRILRNLRGDNLLEVLVGMLENQIGIDLSKHRKDIENLFLECKQSG